MSQALKAAAKRLKFLGLGHLFCSQNSAPGTGYMEKYFLFWKEHILNRKFTGLVPTRLLCDQAIGNRSFLYCFQYDVPETSNNEQCFYMISVQGITNFTYLFNMVIIPHMLHILHMPHIPYMHHKLLMLRMHPMLHRLKSCFICLKCFCWYSCCA